MISNWEEWHADHEDAARILRGAALAAYDELLERASSTFGPRGEYRSLYEAADAWATARGAYRRVSELRWRQ